MNEIILNLSDYLKDSIFLALIISYFAGILTSFTPCVYPLIPITASVITSQNSEHKSKKMSFFLSLSYVLGISLVYALLGMFAALSGKIFGQLSTNPYANLFVGSFIILLALNMLDVFYIPLPSFMQNRNSQNKSKSIINVFFIGLVSGLVVAPCTAPPLAVLLTFVATTQKVFTGGLALFLFSFGMGTLLILIGTFSGFLSTLPKSGLWMVKIKKVLAFLMIIMGEYFIFKAGQYWL